MWNACLLRVFVLTNTTNMLVNIKKTIHDVLYNLRVDGVIEVVYYVANDMSGNDDVITEERTLRGEESARLLRQLNVMRSRKSYNDLASPRIVSPSDVHVTQGVVQAVKLNKIICTRSRDAALVLVCLPHKRSEEDFSDCVCCCVCIDNRCGLHWCSCYWS